ncbi:MAG: Maf family protein [Hyphomicrobiaceae bacterium]
MMTDPIANLQPMTLASASPARKRMLEGAGVRVDVVPARVDEAAIRDALDVEAGNWQPGDVAELLARAKVDDVITRTSSRYVIAADQILAFEGEFYGKPRDLGSARDQLLSLRGKTHELHTAAVLSDNGEVVWVHVDVAYVTLRDFTPVFLGRYLAQAGQKITQSVGCYELEGVGVQLIDRIEGDYFTVLGLPLYAILAELRRRDVLLS